MIPIPSKQTKRWSADLDSDIFGNLIRTRNLDFNKKGYLSLAGKPNCVYTEAENADFQTPIVIVSNDVSYHVITSDQAYELDFTGATPGVDHMTGGNPPSFGFDSDAVVFNGQDVHVSGGTEIGSWSNSGSTWTQRYSSLSSSWPHPMAVSEHQQFLAVGNGNSVILLNTSYVLQTTCTLPAEQIVTWIRWIGNLLYIGTRNIYGGEARMYLWNGSGTAANAGYGVGSEWCMSGTPYENTIVVASISGQLLRFTGNGFAPLRTDDGREANFPIYNAGITWGSGAADSNLMSPIANRGMIAKGRRIFMVVESSNNSEDGHLVNFPSGLWVFDPSVGLYHKAGVDFKRVQIVQPSSVSSNELTLPSAQIFETGDPIYCQSQSGLTGVSNDVTYYAIKTDSTHLKLANTPQQAVDGDNITITGTPGSFDLFQFPVYQTNGAVKVSQSGPVALISRLSLPEDIADEVVYGCETRNATGTNIAAVMTLGIGKNVGSFMTSKVAASQVTDVFKKLIAKFPPLYISQNKIVVKYRTKNRWGAPGRRGAPGKVNAPVTWVDSNSFTINPQEYDAYALQNGDEVEFIYGAGAGFTAHVTNITKTSSTSWTIDIDESLPDITANDQADFIFDNWTKYKVISTADDAKAAAKGFKNMAVTQKGKWIQLKIELRGFRELSSWSGKEAVALEELMIVNGADQKYA